jgi:II/X family phage/plasmid replication protein
VPRVAVNVLIDWLTLRVRISDIQENDLLALMPYMAKLEVKNVLTDEVLKTKLVVDIDSVRSDFIGMVWSISSNGKDKYLNIGASPASLEHGSNLFGSSDYHHCKQVVLNHARKVLKGVCLFNDGWLPRRIDITQNYFLQSHNQVKDALHILRASDGTRQKSTVKGDSVYWGEGSHYRSGKAYDKYIQALELNKKAIKQGKPAIYTKEQLSLMSSILRLEMKLGRQYFDEHTDENDITQEFLMNEHEAFFKKFIGDSEVTDMDKLYEIIQATAPTKGRGLAAYDTYLRIKQNGYEFTKASMPSRTFFRHQKYLLEAGLSISDLTTAKIIELRKRKLTLEPVYNWEHLADLNKKVA